MLLIIFDACVVVFLYFLQQVSVLWLLWIPSSGIFQKKILTYVTWINKGWNVCYTLTCFKCTFVIKFARRLILRDRCQVTIKNFFMILSDSTLSIYNYLVTILF